MGDGGEPEGLETSGASSVSGGAAPAPTAPASGSTSPPSSSSPSDDDEVAVSTAADGRDGSTGAGSTSTSTGTGTGTGSVEGGAVDSSREQEDGPGRARTAAQELLEAALNGLWPCKGCRRSKTRCEGGYPCRRCFQHASPCEPSELAPALEVALKEAAGVDPSASVAAAAAALARQGLAAASPPPAPASAAAAAASSLVVKAATPCVVSTPLLELVFTTNTPRSMAEMYIRGVEKFYPSSAPPCEAPAHAVRMLRSWRMLALLSGGPDISWGIADHIAERLRLTEEDLAVPAADAAEPLKGLLARSRALQASELFQQEEALLAGKGKGTGLFVVGVDAEGRPAHANNEAFVRIGRPAMEVADDVVRHRTLSSLLFSPLISHEDRQLWLDSLAAIAFAPNDALRDGAEEEGGMQTTKVITNFYKAFNAEGDVVLYIITMKRVETGGGGFAIVHHIEPMPASKYITTRPEFKKAAKRYRTLPPSASALGKGAKGGRKAPWTQQGAGPAAVEAPKEEDRDVGFLPLFTGMACLPSPPGAPSTTGAAGRSEGAGPQQHQELLLPRLPAMPARAPLDEAEVEQARSLFPPKEPPVGPPPLPRAPSPAVPLVPTANAAAPASGPAPAPPTPGRSSARLQEVQMASTLAAAAAAATAGASAMDVTEDEEDEEAESARSGPSGKGAVWYQQPVSMASSVSPAPAPGPAPWSGAWAGAEAAVGGEEEAEGELDILLQVLEDAEGLRVPWFPDGAVAVAVAEGRQLVPSVDEEAVAAAFVMDQSR